jgi:hypothetical protein
MKHFFAILLSTLLAVAGITGFRDYRSQYFGRPDAGIHGALTHGPLDLLLIGSSHTYLSYDVRAIERMTGASAYLIGYNGLDLSSMAPVIKYLAVHPAVRPKQVVIETYSSNLAHPPTMSDSRLYFESPPELKKLIVSDYHREHRGVSGVTEMIDLTVNRGNEVILTYPISSKLGGRNTYRGGGRNAMSAGVSRERFSGFRAHINTGVPNPVQSAALQQIIEAGRNSGMSLIFVESPMPEPVSRTQAIQDLKRAFRERLAEQNLPYLDGDTIFPIDSPEFFEDDNHLSGAGRAKFTELVANFVVANRPGNFLRAATASIR